MPEEAHGARAEVAEAAKAKAADGGRRVGVLEFFGCGVRRLG